MPAGGDILKTYRFRPYAAHPMWSEHCQGVQSYACNKTFEGDDTIRGIWRWFIGATSITLSGSGSGLPYRNCSSPSERCTAMFRDLLHECG